MPARISNLIQTPNQVRFLRQRSFTQAHEFSISLSAGIKAVATSGHKVAARLHSSTCPGDEVLVFTLGSMRVKQARTIPGAKL